MTIVEADRVNLSQKEVEAVPERIVVHTFEDYVSRLAGLMEISRDALYGSKGDPKQRGFLDEHLVTSPHQLTGLVKMREDAPDVVLQTVEPLVMTGFGKRVHTGFEISAKANDGLDIKKYRELLQEKITGEIWLDFNSDRATAAAFLAEAARLQVVNTSPLVPDSLKHTGMIAQWERENLEDKAREALGAKKPFRDKDKLGRLAWVSLVLAYGCAPFVSNLPPIDNGDSAGDGGQPDSGDSGSHISPPDNQSGQSDSGDINSPDTPSFESFTPAPDYFINSAIDEDFSVQTSGNISDPDIVSKISAAESRRGIGGFATQALTLTDADGDNELRIYASQGNQSYFYSDVVYDESTGELKYVPPGKGEDGSEHGVFIPMRIYKAENGENVIALAHEFENPDTQEAGWIAVVDVWRYTTDENGNLTSIVYTDPYSKMSVNIGIPEGGLHVQPTPTSPTPTEIPEGLLVSLNKELVESTKVAEPEPGPTLKPNEVAATPTTPEQITWSIVETDIDNDGDMDKEIQFSNGERHELLGDDAYASPDNQLMVLNQETQSWEPVAKIHTMEELLAQVPSEQEMMDFLKSDEIIRATRNYKEAPLGVGPQINNERFGNMESQLDTIIWRSPQLVWLDLVNGEKIIAQVLPVVGTAGTNNLSRPVFLYLIIGKERESVAGFSINGTRGGSNYVVEVEKFSKVFLRGHQISNRVVYGFWDHEKEDEFRESNYPQGILHELILDTFGTETAKALNRLRNGQSVDDGTFIGFNLTFIPGTTISDKGLTSPDF